MATRRAKSSPEIAGLEGREVLLVAPLRTLSRAEAFERVAAAGGRLAESVGPRTAWVVLPGDDVPLGEDGCLPAPLLEARARLEAGAEIELLSEDEFLERLGLEDPGRSLRRLYTTGELARILRLPERRLNAWVRSGLIQPARVEHRLAYFEFRQVAQAKALSRLTARGVTLRRLRASLEELSRWWPRAGASLAQLDALDGGGLVVRTPTGDLAETSGQLRLEFPESHGAGAARGDTVSEAELWFQRGLKLEQEEATEEAAKAYARALDPAEPRPEVAFNLGNALYALERFPEASAAFRLAIQCDPEYVEAWNNLGNALSQLGLNDEACRAFDRALALEPEYADAHFNLAETLAAGGDLEGAREHWRDYLVRDPDSDWAAEVRARLRRTDRS